MGTSGVYGGSQKKPWRDARQLVMNLPAGGDAGDAGNGAPDQELDDVLEDLWGTIGDALDSDDPSLHAPDLDGSKISLPNLMPWLRPSSASGGRGGGGGGGGRGGRTGGGRQGSGSRRQVVRSAARGGAALGAAYAVRQGNAEHLEELGLDLSRLRGLSPLRQCAEILDAVLGEGSHPDELALRKASLASLKEILATETPPHELATVRTFVTGYVFELALVELQQQVNEGDVAAGHVAARERMIRSYVERRVQGVTMATDGKVKPSELRTVVARLTKEVIKVLRARNDGQS